MNRTTIMLPPSLKSRALSLARRQGMSLGAVIREALEARLQGSLRVAEEGDPFWGDDLVFEGRIPRDIGGNHDRYLYGEDS